MHVTPPQETSSAPPRWRTELTPLLDALPFPALVIDARHEVVAQNGLAADPSEPCPCPLSTAASTGEPATREVLDPATGRWSECSVFPTTFLDESGARLYLHFVWDVTEQRSTTQALERSREHQAALIHLLGLVPACEHADQLLREVVDQVASLSWMGLDAGAAAFVAEGTTLRMVHQRRLSPGVLQKCARVPFGACLCGRVADSKKPVACSNLNADHEYRFEGMTDHGHAVLALTDHDETLGVLNFYLPAGAKLDADRAKFLDSVARITSEALARLNLRSKLLRADRMATVGVLAASVAHEVRNPLTYVLYNLESLEGELSQLSRATRGERSEGFDFEVDELREMARDALEGARRIRSIIDDLKIFARNDEDERLPVDVNEAIESAIRLATNEVKYRARVEQTLGDVPAVLGSSGRLGQLLLNLVINAAQAIAPGARADNFIAIRSWQEGDWVNIEVRDSGSGIAPDVLPRVFAPFFTTKPPGVGTGLGLSICKDIAADMGGTIAVESAVGVGTRIVVRLPSAMPGGAAQSAASMHPRRATEALGRVLVVDDDPHVAASLSRMLRGHYEVLTAPSGHAALELLARDLRVDALVSDVMMPTLSGIELHAELDRTRPELARRVVFVTGAASDGEIRSGLERAGRPWLEKPVSSRALLSLLAQIVTSVSADSAASK
ncbi:MAG: response regulator [Myxococcales bacterium]|nr:response regulator [Myxococcales bacterium]